MLQCIEIERELKVKSPQSQRLRFLMGSAFLLKGRMETAAGKGVEAQASWKEALSIVEPLAKDAEGVSDQSTYAQILLCLGRIDEAKPIVKRLMATGYKNPDLLALCREKGVAMN